MQNAYSYDTVVKMVVNIVYIYTGKSSLYIADSFKTPAYSRLNSNQRIITIYKDVLYS